MKKLLALLLSLLMCTTLISGCNKSTPSGGTSVSGNTLQSKEEISYVMIYNPEIYDEYNANKNEKLTTGDFGDYVEAVISRADVLKETPPYISTTTKLFEGLDLSKFDLEGGKGGSFIIPYQVGDRHDFYVGGDDPRKLETLVCKYAGEHCNIWTYNNYISDEDAKAYGEEFDKKIYESLTKTFGKSRFYDNGGKINLLFYQLTDGLLGFFWGRDIFASDEVDEETKEYYGLNTDHDILHINSLYKDIPMITNSTMAHEFQHLLCATSAFETYSQQFAVRTWLNEGMSGYIEENLYPGSKEIVGHYDEFNASDRIRHGQSLYNFDNDTSGFNSDIGVYGSVYYFSEYLVSLSGKNIFSDIYSYWRNSYSTTLDEAEAIYNSMSNQAKRKIDNMFDFSKLNIEDTEDEFLSKLTLSFYLSTLKEDSSNPDSFKKIDQESLLYDEINPANIEGGGRVIVALKDGEFQFPEDADEGLVYIGLNKDFEVVTDIVIR